MDGVLYWLESIITLIGNNFHRYVLPFLDNREGKITKGTDPYFTEGIYDEARDAVLSGEINDLADLSVFFSERSIDITKLGEDEAPIKLTIERGNAWDYDGLITGVTFDETTEPELIGSAVGANGIVELLESNRDKLGVKFVDRAIALLSNIPEKYLTDLTMSINTSLRTE